MAEHAAEVARRFDVDVVPTAPGENDFRRMRRARTLRRVFMAVVAVFLLLGLSGTLGVRTRTVTATGGDYELTVTYGHVSRPGLPTPWEFEVHRAGGFEGPITVSTSSKYLDLFDENGFDPDPLSATTDEERIIWTFEPPGDGDTMTVSFDARVEPGVQLERAKGFVSVLEEGEAVVTVNFSTLVLA